MTPQFCKSKSQLPNHDKVCLPQPRRCCYLLQENCHFLFVAGARIQTHGPCTRRKKLHLQTNCKSRLWGQKSCSLWRKYDIPPNQIEVHPIFGFPSNLWITTPMQHSCLSQNHGDNLHTLASGTPGWTCAKYVQKRPAVPHLHWTSLNLIPRWVPFWSKYSMGTPVTRAIST